MLVPIVSISSVCYNHDLNEITEDIEGEDKSNRITIANTDPASRENLRFRIVYEHMKGDATKTSNLDLQVKDAVELDLWVEV